MTVLEPGPSCVVWNPSPGNFCSRTFHWSGQDSQTHTTTSGPSLPSPSSSVCCHSVRSALWPEGSPCLLWPLPHRCVSRGGSCISTPMWHLLLGGSKLAFGGSRYGQGERDGTWRDELQKYCLIWQRNLAGKVGQWNEQGRKSVVEQAWHADLGVLSVWCVINTMRVDGITRGIRIVWKSGNFYIQAN